jgi:hypothetical protein
MLKQLVGHGKTNNAQHNCFKSNKVHVVWEFNPELAGSPSLDT